MNRLEHANRDETVPVTRQRLLRDSDREMFALALPALGALIAEPLYVLADTAVIGNIGTNELGGLALASQVIGTVLSVSLFLAYGTTSAALARCFDCCKQNPKLRNSARSICRSRSLAFRPCS